MQRVDIHSKRYIFWPSTHNGKDHSLVECSWCICKFFSTKSFQSIISHFVVENSNSIFKIQNLSLGRSRQLWYFFSLISSDSMIENFLIEIPFTYRLLLQAPIAIHFDIPTYRTDITMIVGDAVPQIAPPSLCDTWTNPLEDTHLCVGNHSSPHHSYEDVPVRKLFVMPFTGCQLVSLRFVEGIPLYITTNHSDTEVLYPQWVITDQTFSVCSNDPNDFLIISANFDLFGSRWQIYGSLYPISSQNNFEIAKPINAKLWGSIYDLKNSFQVATSSGKTFKCEGGLIAVR